MQRLQAFKFELRPNGTQERNMRRFAGACRFVYNEALALQKARYERGEKKLGYARLCELLTQCRNSAQTSWLRDAPTHPLQQAFKDLGRAYKNFFAGRAALPKFKKRGQRDSFRYPDPKQFKLDQGQGQVGRCRRASVDRLRAQRASDQKDCCKFGLNRSCCRSARAISARLAR
jgi:putative transposase